MQTSISKAMMQPIKLVPPDGGYGWVIVIAYGLANVSDFCFIGKIAIFIM